MFSKFWNYNDVTIIRNSSNLTKRFVKIKGSVGIMGQTNRSSWSLSLWLIVYIDHRQVNLMRYDSNKVDPLIKRIFECFFFFSFLNKTFVLFRAKISNNCFFLPTIFDKTNSFFFYYPCHPNRNKQIISAVKCIFVQKDAFFFLIFMNFVYDHIESFIEMNFVLICFFFIERYNYKF